MKLIHISDIHISPSHILGFDPVDNFEKCIAHIAEFQADAECLVITGDLTHRGEPESYARLKEILAASPLKGKLAPRLMIGNHDNRQNFLTAFPDARRDENGFAQWTEETAAGLFVYLDSTEPGTHAGHYCARRTEWLIRVLERAQASGVPVWLFMHHNPISVHVANADEIGMVEEVAFRALLKRFSGTIRHIFFGHCHFTLSGQVSGIPFSAPRSTNHVCWPDFSGIPERMGYGAFSPTYNVCFLEEDGTVIHSIDFLDEHKVKWAV